MPAPLQPQAVSPSPGALWQAVATPAAPSPDPQPPWVAFGETLETFLPSPSREPPQEAAEGDENLAAAPLVVGLDVIAAPSQPIQSETEPRGGLVTSDASVTLLPAQRRSFSLGPSASSTPELGLPTGGQTNPEAPLLDAAPRGASPEQLVPPFVAPGSGDASAQAPIDADQPTIVQATSVAATAVAEAVTPTESRKTQTPLSTPEAMAFTGTAAETSKASANNHPPLVAETEPRTTTAPQDAQSPSTEPQTLVTELLAQVEEHLDPTRPDGPPKLDTEVQLDTAPLIAGDPVRTASAPAPSRVVEVVPLAAEPVPLEQLGGHLIRAKQEMTADAARLEVTLDPPELGRITIELAEVDERVSARLIVSESTTLEAVKQNMSSMMDSLADAGVDVHDFQLESSLAEHSSEGEETTDRVPVDVDAPEEQVPAEVSDSSGVNLLI